MFNLHLNDLIDSAEIDYFFCCSICDFIYWVNNKQQQGYVIEHVGFENKYLVNINTKKM